MANTFTQIYIQVVFAVQGRQSLIPRQHKEELFKYITGVVKNRNQKLIAINGMANHLHMFVGMKPDIALSDLVRDVKSASSGFFNEQRWVSGKFSWQEGFGGFSYSHSQIDSVVKYIMNQEEHHRQKTFQEEYLELLKEFNIEYDGRYVFKWIQPGHE